MLPDCQEKHESAEPQKKKDIDQCEPLEGSILSMISIIREPRDLNRFCLVVVREALEIAHLRRSCVCTEGQPKDA